MIWFGKNRKKRCMCCGNIVPKVDVYESPSPLALHYKEWYGIKKIEICKDCSSKWSNIAREENYSDQGITRSNKWLFDRISDREKQIRIDRVTSVRNNCDVSLNIITILLTVQVMIWGLKLSNKLDKLDKKLSTDIINICPEYPSTDLPNVQLCTTAQALCLTNAYVKLEEVEEVPGVYTNRNADGTYIDLVRLNGKLYKVCK